MVVQWFIFDALRGKKLCPNFALEAQLKKRNQFLFFSWASKVAETILLPFKDLISEQEKPWKKRTLEREIEKLKTDLLSS